ncbi:hypothetical protein Tco_0862138 [Tanacetum coccineum]
MSVLKLKNFKKDATLKLFKSTNQVRYEHVGPTITSSQDGKAELVQETTNKVILIKEKLKAARDYQKSYKYLADTNLHVHFEEIKVDKTLHFVEEPVEIIDREVKSLKRSRVPIVKSIGTRSEVMRIS